MSVTEAQEITANRLASWSKKVAQMKVTPFCLVMVGHDEISGEIHVLAPEGVDNKSIRRLLLNAAELLRD